MFLPAVLLLVTGSLVRFGGEEILRKCFTCHQRQDDPCTQAKPFVDAVTTFFNTASFQTGINLVQTEMTADPLHEHVITFGTGSDGDTVLSGVITGTKSNSRVPAINNAFADLHNHPRNTPPSSGDLYGLLQNNGKNPAYATRFVLTAAGKLYALVVTDTAAARRFLRNHPFQQIPGYSKLFPDALLDEYREIQQRYGAVEEVAMAYVLEKYGAGVSLLRRIKNTGFKKIKAVVTTSGTERIFALGYCS